MERNPLPGFTKSTPPPVDFGEDPLNLTDPVDPWMVRAEGTIDECSWAEMAYQLFKKKDKELRS